jgi:hypothetical protein
MNIKSGDQAFSVGFGFDYGNISTGYQMEAPTILLQLLLVPVMIEAPVLVPVLVRIPL